jgi:hypothetical protein
MAFIITAHIANTNANSITFQGAVVGIIQPMPAGIIRKPEMSTPPISMSSASHHR